MEVSRDAILACGLLETVWKLILMDAHPRPAFAKASAYAKATADKSARQAGTGAAPS
jgi:hypothetical protein